MESKHTVVSLFSGLGGLDLGFHWEGFRTIWANDLYPHATSSFARNFGIECVTGDITKIDLDEIPKGDLVIGGPPCQSFSLVGKRQADDPRGKLVFRFYEVVKKLKPQVFVMENVPGMAASKIDGVRLPEILKNMFSELGYNVTVMNLNADNYLVPQRRKRMVMVGSLSCTIEKPDSKRFAKECYGIDIETYNNSAKSAIEDLGDCTLKGQRALYKSIEPSVFAKLMRRDGQGTVSLHEMPRMSETDKLLVQSIPPGGNYMDIPDEIAPGRALKFKKTGGRTTTYGRLHPDRPSYTINTYFRRPNVGCNFHYKELRLITAREAMRFQSIPDSFELVYSSQDQRNSLIGNAVPPIMARAIAWAVKKTLSKSEYSS